VLRGAGSRLLPSAFAALVTIVAVPALSQGFTIPPTPNHYVTDNAGALSAGARAAIENELQGYETATGHQVIVYIANTTGGVPLET